MTRMLASVLSVEEAVLALEAGADLIDLKDPRRGALGALDARVAREIVAVVAHRCLLSATAGDFPAMQPRALVAAAQRAAGLGVHFVKVGFFGTPRDQQCMRALTPLAAQTRLVAVLFADLAPTLDCAQLLSEARFAGVMLDTARKDGAGLPALLSRTQLAHFVGRARASGLITGLAGKLRLADIEPLLGLGADYLGFRGALCAKHERSAALDPAALQAVRRAIPLAAPLCATLGSRIGHQPAAA